MPDCFEAAVGPPPRTPFACLADNDLARRVLPFFEDFLVLLVAMVCSPSDSAESFPPDRCSTHSTLPHSVSLCLRWFLFTAFPRPAGVRERDRSLVARSARCQPSRRVGRVPFLTRCSRRAR